MAQPGAGGSDSVPPGGGQPKIEKVNIGPVAPTVGRPITTRQIIIKDLVRLLIVILLFVAFLGTIAFAFVGALTAETATWNNVKALLDLLLPAETALLGVAVAFYMTEAGSSE